MTILKGATVVGLDDGEHLLQPWLAVDRCAGVDDHGLGAADHHRVDRQEQPVAGRSQVRDQEGLGGDELRLGRRSVLVVHGVLLCIAGGRTGS